MKKPLRWPALPPGGPPRVLLAHPRLRAWGEDERRNALPPMTIPKACYESQQRALKKLMLQAGRLKPDPRGDASIGDTRINAEQMFLAEVEATGTVCASSGLFDFIRRLWDPTSPERSEARLNRFLIKLGRALAATRKRRDLPDWLQGVDQTEWFIAEGWCGNICVDGEDWPPLCCFTTPALVKFLRLCRVSHCKLAAKDPRTIERAIARLGLVRIPRGRIRHVEKRFGEFRFA